MASTVLPNGIIIPEKYSRDWYADLYHNWQELDNLLGGGTPKDGTLTIQKNGTAVGTFSANQATDETLNITVPDVNDATLTIQQNGANVQTFTANASTNATANIQCVDLTNNQTVAGNKEFTGTTTAHDLVPSATDTYNFGSSTAQWNNAYIKSLTINGTAAGDILTHNVSEFVDVSGNQTIDGIKTFSNLRTYFGRDISCYSTRKYGKNLNPASNTYQYLNFSGNTVSDGTTNDWSSGCLEQVVNTNGGARGRWFVQDTSENSVALELWASGNDKQVRPFQNGNIDLGTSTKKWKSFNGINPGALSLPSVSSGINLDLTNFKTDGSDNKFRLTNFSNYPYNNGWLFIRLNGCTSYYLDHWYKVVSNEYANPSTAIFFMPINDIDHDILLRCVCTSINYIRVFPCQGNV